MEIFNGAIERFMMVTVTGCIHILELIGVVIIMLSALRALYHYFRRTPGMRLKFAEGMALALEFKLGGEILRTVVARDWNEIAIVGAIIALRGFLTFLIHWEIKGEQSRSQSEQSTKE